MDSVVKYNNATTFIKWFDGKVMSVYYVLQCAVKSGAEGQWEFIIKRVEERGSTVCFDRVELLFPKMINLFRLFIIGK